MPALAAVVLGVSGAWDDSTNSVYAVPNLPGLEGSDLLSPLEGLGRFPIEVENDVRLAALAEYAEGVGTYYRSMFLLSLDSGVGGAYIVGGQSHRGSRGFAGEVGYIPVWNGRGYTALEDVVSTTSLQRAAAGLGVTLDEIFSEGGNGHHDLSEMVVRSLGVAICSVVSTISPDVVVIGGELSRYGDFLIPRVQDVVREMLPTQPPIVQAALQPSAALRGATLRGAALARSYLVKRA